VSIEAAARAISSAEHLLITAGAGMGVDSGLPDFRGAEGFWRAYPPYRALGLAFEDLANPATFQADPELAWGFYGHRLELYRRITPHAGFAILRAWAATKQSAFVSTSNVDGQFQRAGFSVEQVHEVHGSIHVLQCTVPCGPDLFSADGVTVTVDEGEMRARAPLPTCPRCGQLARPNILMFGDPTWIEHREEAQRARFDAWLQGVGQGRLAVVELGAGVAIPSMRILGEALARRGATLIRINPRDAQGPEGAIRLAAPAAQTLAAIDRALG
jgi:NAD-dependent SIR2 family protein deacetylase